MRTPGRAMPSARSVTPRTFDQKSKMRLIEHGPSWSVEAATSPLRPDMALLKSAGGYLKWWPATHLGGAAA